MIFNIETAIIFLIAHISFIHFPSVTQEESQSVQAEACPAGILQAFTVETAAFLPFWLKYVGKSFSADGKEVVVI